jgi:hypothetical protein
MLCFSLRRLVSKYDGTFCAIIAAVNPSVAAIVKNKFFIFIFVLFFIN